MNFNKEQVYSGFSQFYQSLGLNFTQIHKKNLEFLLLAIERDHNWKDVRQVSYFLATIFWETAKTLAPIKEIRAKPGTAAYTLQQKYWNTGYYGRGYLQITHKSNYEKLSKVLGVDLVANPDLMLTPQYSYMAAAYGILTGLFTGKKLSDYINSTTDDRLNARRTVNGTDRAALIADFSKKIENILVHAYSNPVVVETVAEPASIVAASPLPDSISILKTEASKPSGWATWKTTITTVLGALGISGASISGWFQERWHDPTTAKILLISGMALSALAIVSFVVYMILRVILIIKRETMANQVTLEELRIRANPALHNVEIYK